MSARLIGMTAFALAISVAPSVAGGIAETKAAPVGKNEGVVATAMPPLAERVDALVRGKNLKPGVSMGLANANGTVQLTVTELKDGRVVRLINLSTRAIMGEWHLSGADQQGTDSAAAVVFQSMGIEAPSRLSNKSDGVKTHAH